MATKKYYAIGCLLTLAYYGTIILVLVAIVCIGVKLAGG